tara:strand:+ start:1071 stop:1457 length:387 start_codon:yes stop_codon:yes gene_type:complete
MAINFDLGLYHFKSYKNGQFEPDVNFKKGEIVVTFEYDGTNDIYIIPMFLIETFYRQKNYKISLEVISDDFLVLDNNSTLKKNKEFRISDLIHNLKLDYKSCLDSNGNLDSFDRDIDINKITVKDIMF